MFDWSDEKDSLLRRERGVSFQDVIYHISQGDVLALSDHPNVEKYPNQRIMYVRMNDYVYMVPYVENDSGLFLKTIIPSRKATKHYLEEKR